LQLFAASGLESEEFYTIEDLSNGMGLFLQKTNIIRDYLEDIVEEPAPRYHESSIKAHTKSIAACCADSDTHVFGFWNGSWEPGVSSLQYMRLKLNLRFFLDMN